MELEKDSLTDWIQLAFTLMGGIYALYLLRQANKDKRNQFVLDVLNKIYNDHEVRTILYSVDTGRDVKEIRFQGQLEKEADKTIRYFDYIGYQLKQRNIKQEDIEPFRYEIDRILINKQVEEYVEWLRAIGVQLEYLRYLRKE